MVLTFWRWPSRVGVQISYSTYIKCLLCFLADFYTQAFSKIGLMHFQLGHVIFRDNPYFWIIRILRMLFKISPTKNFEKYNLESNLVRIFFKKWLWRVLIQIQALWNVVTITSHHFYHQAWIWIRTLYNHFLKNILTNLDSNYNSQNF